MNNNLKIPLENLGNYFVPKDARGGLCVDIGSNVGSFLKQVHNVFREIHYYEPIKQCFDLCQDFSKNYPHIHGHNVAVYNKKSRCNVLMHKNKLAGSSAISCLDEDILLLEHADKNNVINSVDTISLEEIYTHVNNQDIDYCKCDCEISEYYILMNKDLSKIKYLFMELHWQMGEERFQELVNYISKTHALIYGNCTFPGKFDNREVLFMRKA